MKVRIVKNARKGCIGEIVGKRQTLIGEMTMIMFKDGTKGLYTKDSFKEIAEK